MDNVYIIIVTGENNNISSAASVVIDVKGTCSESLQHNNVMKLLSVVITVPIPPRHGNKPHYTNISGKGARE